MKSYPVERSTTKLAMYSPINVAHKEYTGDILSDGPIHPSLHTN